MTSDDPPINRCRELTTKQKFAVVVSFCLVFVGVVVLFVWNVNYYQAKTDKSSQNDTGTYLDGAFQSDLDLLTAFNAILQRNAYNGYKKPMWEELNETVTTHRKRQIELIGNEDPDHQFQLALSRYNSAKRNSSANLEIEKERVQEALILSRLEFMENFVVEYVAWSRKDYASRLEAFFAQIDKTANESIGWIPEENFWANYTPGLSASCLIPYPDPTELVEMYYTAFKLGDFGCYPEEPTPKQSDKTWPFTVEESDHIILCVLFALVVFFIITLLLFFAGLCRKEKEWWQR